MYSWFWRKLPFGLVGKLISMFALGGATVALLWYIVFPWATPLLPFDDVQVGTGADTQQGPGDQDPNTVTSKSPAPQTQFTLPYSTKSNNPVPSRSPSKIVLPGD